MKALPPIIIDSSIFIGFFRGDELLSAILENIIHEERVLLSVFVRLELITGIKKSERKKISELLDSFSLALPSNHFYTTAESLIPLYKEKGMNVGLVDFFICLQALDAGAQLYTADQELAKLASTLGVDLYSK